MTATAAIHERCVEDLQALIQGLNLVGQAGITGDILGNVLTPLTFDESNAQFPCVLLSVEEESEEEDGETTTFESDGVIYPVRILILDRVSARFEQARPVYLGWRRQILKKLRSLVISILPNTPECWKIGVRAMKIFDPRLPQYQFMVSGMTALCYTNEPRQIQ